MQRVCSEMLSSGDADSSAPLARVSSHAISGAPGLYMYTLNLEKSAQEIVRAADRRRDPRTDPMLSGHKPQPQGPRCRHVRLCRSVDLEALAG